MNDTETRLAKAACSEHAPVYRGDGSHRCWTCVVRYYHQLIASDYTTNHLVEAERREHRHEVAQLRSEIASLTYHIERTPR